MSYNNPTCDLTDDDWDNFVYSHPRGNIFQTKALYKVYAETKNYCPVSVAVINPISREIEGVMSGVVIREMDGFLGGFSSRSIVQGGPLVSTSSKQGVLTELVHRYESYTSQSSIYNEIRNMYNMQDQLRNLEKKYTFVEHLNYIINLNQSIDQLWKQIHRTKRNKIRRAESAGVVVEELETSYKIPIFYKILSETYNNVKVPLADISLFESAFNLLVQKGLVKFFLARYENNYIGARAVLIYKGRIYDWYAGAVINDLGLYPNECLVWHILKWGILNNYSNFDFGGAGEPNKPYGPREFKRRFGGEMVNYGRYVHQYSKVKIRVAEIGFRVYQKLFF